MDEGAKPDRRVKLYTDAAYRPKLGVAGVAYVILDENDELIEAFAMPVPATTNNQAEYQGLVAGLLACAASEFKNVDVFMDARLVTEQLNKNYKVKNPILAVWYGAAQFYRTEHFDSVTFTHIPREQNKDTDRMAGKAAVSGQEWGPFTKMEDIV